MNLCYWPTQIIGYRPLCRVGAPVWEILDPPLVRGIHKRKIHYTYYEGRFLSVHRRDGVGWSALPLLPSTPGQISRGPPSPPRLSLKDCLLTYNLLVFQALETLRNDPEKAGGEAFFIVDNTPLTSMVETVKPFLESRGYKLTPFKVPFWLFSSLIILLEIIAKLISPIYKIRSVLNYKIVRNLYNSHSFSCSKAEQRLDYKALFSYYESIALSRKYYDNIE